MISNYNYADYNSLSDDQKLLWWFDEYLRYDLVLFNRRFAPSLVEVAFLIERHDIYYYLSWANNYSYYLWNLLCNKSYESIMNTFSAPCDLIIPDSVKNKIIITYLHETGDHVSLLQRVDNNINTKIFTKHHIYGKSKERIYIPGCLAYSVVINGDKNDISIIENLLPFNCLYKNIDSWVDSCDDILPDFFSGLIETKKFLRQPQEYNEPLKDPDFFLDAVSLRFNFETTNFTEYTREYNLIPLPYSKKVDIQLVYGRPTNLFINIETGLSIFDKEIQELPNNKSFGSLFASVAIYDLIYISNLTPNYVEGKLNLFIETFDYEEIIGDTGGKVTTISPGWGYSIIDYVPTQLELSSAVALWPEPFMYYGVPLLDSEKTFPGSPQGGFFASLVRNEDGEYEGGGAYVYKYMRLLDSYGVWSPIITAVNSVIGVVGYGYTIRFVAQIIQSLGEPKLFDSLEFQKTNILYLRSVNNAVNILNTLILQTENIKKRKITLSNLREIKDNNGNLVQNINYIEEYVMGLEIMVQEIHACLGASEFAYYDDNGTQKPYYMSVSRTLNWFAKAYGVSFNPDGTIMPLRQRVNIAYDSNGKATIPDGWTRGQFADNEGNSTTGQTGGQTGEERMGIVYQNRCNQYENFDDADPKNNILKRGDLILCENYLQLFESYLEDMDKGLNWQEMGTGILPSADGTSICTYEGIGTLLAEVAYMLSTLSSNIYQTHSLALKNYSTTLEILKGLGLPIEMGFLPIDLGENDPLTGTVESFLNVPQVADGAVSLHKRLMDVITNLAALNASVLNPLIEEPPSNP